MALSAFHRFSENSRVIGPASFKERVIAQLIDGIILGMISGLWLAVYSGGQVYSMWVSPMVPLYLVQAAPEFTTRISDWWWGGYYETVSLPFIADLNIAYPSLVLWLLYGSYYTLFHTFYGQTPGKMMKSLVVLNEKGEMLSWKISFIRWLGYLLSVLPLGSGFWILLKDNNSFTMHDSLMKTKVVAF